MNLAPLHEAAHEHHEAGRLAEAETIYQGLLELAPDDVAALQALGYLKLQARRPAEALPYYEKAFALSPEPAFALYRGECLLHLQRISEACEWLAWVVQVKPEWEEAHFHQGLALLQQDRIEEAAAAFRCALKGSTEKARLLKRISDALDAHGKHAAGAEILTSIVQELPDLPEPLYVLGRSLAILGRHAEARPYLETVIARQADHADAHFLLGIGYREARDFTRAIALFQEAARLRPEHVEAMNSLAILLADADRLNEAVAVQSAALQVNPDYVPSLNNVAGCLVRQGKVEKALVFYRRIYELQPRFPAFASNYIFTLNYSERETPASLFEQHRRYEESLEPLAAREPLAPLPSPAGRDRRLRIGFVSGDLRAHPVATWLEPLLVHLDRGAFELHAFSTLEHEDGCTERLRGRFHGWHRLVGLEMAEALDRIRREKIDVLVDLSGHTGKNLLPVFAARAAPVQMAMLGYPNTTGLRTMDLRLTDDWADPPGQTERFHTETLLRLPRTAWCYQAHGDSPPTARDTARREIVFGSFNNLAKMQPGLIRLWARLLRETPGSRLYLKSAGLQDPHLRRHYESLFEQEGVSAQRLRLEGRRTGMGDHLACYREIDVALDTFPYHGTTTTADALWMGTPVVTLAGPDHRSRVGASLLQAVGHPEWIAATPEDYLSVARKLAGSAETRARLHATLREEMRTSPLMDAAGYAREFGQALRTWIDNQKVETGSTRL